ncbi:two-component system response regulator [Clostridium sp. chh4-2]|uniref:response regulator n=1 Tax=Clostridium sp. chh4-2 TaxID=2067550 RepID=UPI000CCE161A|nr:response regulator [Clostridium sp. chh4-2]PNV62197.1 two-component system response regulator [Clostridium sp. chh4-2]
MDKKILVVDDALFMRAMLKKVLNEAGFDQVIEAVDGEEADLVYEKEKPDLVLMDISMPKLNGIEALKRIKKRDPEALVIMCSAVGQEAMIIEAMDAGAYEFIVKPFKPEQIIRSIKAALGITEVE